MRRANHGTATCEIANLVPWSWLRGQRHVHFPRRFKFCLHTWMIWCGVSIMQAGRRAAGGWRGSAARQTHWRSAEDQSKNRNCHCRWPRAMHACLTVGASSIELSIQASQLLHATNTFSDGSIESHRPISGAELDLNSRMCGAHPFHQDGIILPIWRYEDDTDEDWSESSWSFQREAWTGVLDSHQDIQVGREKYHTFREESRSLRPFWH